MIRSLVLALSLLVSGAAAAQPVSIFGNASPVHPVINDSGAVTLGVRFFANEAGTVSAIRFYRGRANSNGYQVRLYTSGGTLLASASVSSDTCAVPCWEQVAISPIAVQANTTYVAAYYTSNGDYAGDNMGLFNGAGASPLFAVADTKNGVYIYSNSFPTKVYQSTNYWVDLLFTPSGGPPPPTLSLTVNPASPSYDPTTATVGQVIATVSATWSDGSPFTGSISFVSPDNNDNGAFALSGNSLVLAAPALSFPASTQYVTLQAVQ